MSAAMPGAFRAQNHQPLQLERQRDANYIVYLLDGDGKIRGAEWIAAVSDDHALAQVRALGSATPCELWQLDRKIGRVPPRRPFPSSP
jgi:hypothetical protein